MTTRFATVAALSLLLTAASPGLAQQGPAQAGPYGPYGMGPAMMAGGGYGPGPGMMGGGFGMAPGMMGSFSRYPDGSIAFLKAELKITPDQETAWSKLADALRAQSSVIAGVGPRGMMGTGAGPVGPAMMQGNWQNWQPPALPDALDRRVDLLQKQLESAKAIRDAAKPLYAKLSSDQRTKADRLLGSAMYGF